ncbi:MAG: uroporphyrinogen-III synthase [Burkholderiales bacterium]|nr:MAG: uroporphyrinogen-III synthase [Burkholderiales bacterium]
MALAAPVLVALAHPEPRAGEIASRLCESGYECLRLGLIRLDPAAHRASARAAAARIPSYDLVIFVSPTAIAFFADAWSGPWPRSTAIAVVGTGSEAALRQAGIDAEGLQLLMPAERADVDALLELPAMAHVADRRVLVVRGSVGREDWIGRLRARGAEVDTLIAFDRLECDPVAEVAARLRAAHDAGRTVVFVVTTTRTAERLDRWIADGERAVLAPWLRSQPALVIHPRIAECLRALGWRDVSTIAPGTGALLSALESLG